MNETTCNFTTVECILLKQYHS